jgi:GT2 family glycosyltransferase
VTVVTPEKPTVSFVLATRNRRDVLLRTLERVEICGLEAGAFETFVVDNASTDGSADAVREKFPTVRLIPLSENRGSCAKAWALPHIRSEYTVFLDDDSHPHPGSIARMIEHFDSDGRLGAAGFRVHLPDGTEECSAFPSVFVGCGVGFRTALLHKVGGLDAGLFMQAEEYDLSFRLVNTGWNVRTFADLHVAHLKTPQARISARTTYYDTRNNLLLVDRYLPDPWRKIYRQDWLRRYGWLAARNGHRGAFARAVAAATLRARSERRRYESRRLTPAAFEELFLHQRILGNMNDLARSGVQRVVFADLGKNICAFLEAARKTGISVLAIADDRFEKPGRRYRGIRIVPFSDIGTYDVDAIVVSNTSPVHASETRRRLKSAYDLPLYQWIAAPESSQQCCRGPIEFSDKPRIAESVST